MRIATAHGMHRRSLTHGMPYTTHAFSTSMLENNVRIWWTTYIIERSLELLMGRPCQIRDEDIDRESATELNEFPSRDGLQAHVTLAMIMGQIVSQVFRPRKRRKQDIDNVMMSLRVWKETLPSQLKLTEGEYAMASQSVLLLHLLHNQVNLLASGAKAS